MGYLATPRQLICEDSLFREVGNQILLSGDAENRTINAKRVIVHNRRRVD